MKLLCEPRTHHLHEGSSCILLGRVQGGNGKCFIVLFDFKFLYAWFGFFFFAMCNFPPFCNKVYMKSRSDEKVITPCCNVENMLVQLNMF